jgi:hypothetical protein
MLLEVRREPSARGCTLGSLYVDGEFECFTLEDVIREVPEQAVEKWKVDGDTAIPSGIYEVVVNMSTRFSRLLPLLVNVPGFQGVRIHSGNVAADTEGCILVGQRQTQTSVLNSHLAFNALFARIQAALEGNEKVYIRITNPIPAQPQVSIV